MIGVRRILRLTVIMAMLLVMMVPTGALAKDGGNSQEAHAAKGNEVSAARAEENAVKKAAKESTKDSNQEEVASAPTQSISEEEISLESPAEEVIAPAVPVVEAAPFVASQNTKPESEPEPVSIRVSLNPAHVGTTYDSAGTWHFVLVDLGKDAGTGVVTVTFKNAGTLVLQCSKVNEQMQHFVVTLPAEDTLLGAYADVMLPELKDGVKLNLSSFTPSCPPPSDEPTTPVPPDDPNPPSDEPTPTPTPTPTPPNSPTPPTDTQLPYTGGEALIILAAALGAGGAGFGFKRLSRKQKTR